MKCQALPGDERPNHEMPSMIASNPITRIEQAELSNLVNKCKVARITKCNMENIEHSLKNRGSLNAMRRKPSIGKNKLMR